MENPLRASDSKADDTSKATVPNSTGNSGSKGNGGSKEDGHKPQPSIKRQIHKALVTAIQAHCSPGRITAGEAVTTAGAKSTDPALKGRSDNMVCEDPANPKRLLKREESSLSGTFNLWVLQNLVRYTEYTEEIAAIQKAARGSMVLLRGLDHTTVNRTWHIAMNVIELSFAPIPDLKLLNLATLLKYSKFKSSLLYKQGMQDRTKIALQIKCLFDFLWSIGFLYLDWKGLNLAVQFNKKTNSLIVKLVDPETLVRFPRLGAKAAWLYKMTTPKYQYKFTDPSYLQSQSEAGGLVLAIYRSLFSFELTCIETLAFHYRDVYRSTKAALLFASIMSDKGRLFEESELILGSAAASNRLKAAYKHDWLGLHNPTRERVKSLLCR